MAKQHSDNCIVLLGESLLLDHCGGSSAIAIAAMALMPFVGSAHATIATRPTNFAADVRFAFENFANNVHVPAALLLAKLAQCVGPGEEIRGGAIRDGTGAIKTAKDTRGQDTHTNKNKSQTTKKGRTSRHKTPEKQKRERRPTPNPIVFSKKRV